MLSLIQFLPEATEVSLQQENYSPPSLPDLSKEKIISLDIETFDPNLSKKLGASWTRNEGRILGISIATEKDAWYFPIGHFTDPEKNINKEVFLKWFSKTIANQKLAICGANLLYDIGWIASEGIEVTNTLYDVQFAEALLSESAKIKLDIISKKYLGIGKQTAELESWIRSKFPVKKDFREFIYKASQSLTEEYAKQDAVLPLRILKKQIPLLKAKGLLKLFALENSLILLLVKMKKEGVTIDSEKVFAYSQKCLATIAEKQQVLDTIGGESVSVNNKDETLLRLFHKLKIQVPKTAKGNPSFEESSLLRMHLPVCDKIIELRKLKHIQNAFIEGVLINKTYQGKIFCDFHPLRGDKYGTRSGRFSSSDPNLQQIPKKFETGNHIRTFFIPDKGHIRLRKYDYGQIEYRMLAIFAVGEGAEELRQTYRDNPNIDYHTFVQNLIKEKTGINLKRTHAKSINFGLIYGMGKETLMKQLELDSKGVKELFEHYHRALPYVETTMLKYSKQASEQGFVTTLLNRRSLFEMYEPNIRGYHKFKPLKYQPALRTYGSNIKRAGTHKALNRVLQGSAADVLKVVMSRCFKEKVFLKTGIPRLTVHDELVFSDEGGKEEAFAEMQAIMENPMPLDIPLKADAEIGLNWGETNFEVTP